MSARFSRRSFFSREPNRLSRALEERLARGLPVLDLTESLPVMAGLHPPPQVLEALTAAASMRYQPEPRGSLRAREALAARAASQGVVISPEQILLSASTSESYTWLFKLLCNPGDNVLVPRPCYPLFDYLAQLEAVEVRGYPLVREAGWALDLEALAAAADARTRAVLVVHPGNPTGHFLSLEEAEALGELCAERGWALISDEVFADFAHAPVTLRSLAMLQAPVLCFCLSGLSKVVGLPGLKVGWLSVHGPPVLQEEALARLELIADSYLSVNAPAQEVLPELLAHASAFQARVMARVADNRSQLLKARPSDASWDVLPSDGGWSALVRIPEYPGEEVVALALLDAGVRVHPGHFYDFPTGAFLVLSLVQAPGIFTPALKTLVGVL